MLARLSIRDVLLVEELDVFFGPGFSALTGETGAGKSILLDSLGLALGQRADSTLVRSGCPQLSVTAVFEMSVSPFIQDVLSAHELIVAEGEPLILRRTVSHDGRSRAFVNDAPVSVGLLRTLGKGLVEVHGQWDTRALSETSTHQKLLDAWAGIDTVSCCQAWECWQNDARLQREFLKDMDMSRAEEDVLRHMERDLVAIAPRHSEEADLLSQRRLLVGAEKIREGLDLALCALSVEGDGVDARLRTASRALERLESYVGPRFSAVMSALDRAAIDVSEIRGALEREQNAVASDPHDIDQLDDRLFALRSLARKHGCLVDQLPDVLEQVHSQLQSLEDGSQKAAELAKKEAESREQYLCAARVLSEQRRLAALRLDAAVAAELPSLKLGQARFITGVEDVPEGQWGAAGTGRVVFKVSANPGTDPDVLGKSVSGGELSRFMLILRVILARASLVPTVIFDEIDAGMGGATAAAVGEHLARLSQDVQTLAVTHSPQVAARAHEHWRVMKYSAEEQTTTSVIQLGPAERREEVARMLAGETITESARAAADSLLVCAG